MAREGAAVERLECDDAERRQRAVAGSLTAAGCQRGDRVAFVLPSSANLLCALLGAARVGIVPVVLSATLLPAERQRLLDDAEVQMVVDDAMGLAGLVEGPPAELAPWPLTRAMHYTSGTTGQPKGVFTGVWDDATARQVFDDEADLWDFSADDRHLVCSPLHHTVSARFAGGTLLRGGSVLVLSRFEAGVALGALRSLRPTSTFVAPTHLQRLLALPELGSDERFESLRLLVHAGSPCSPALKQAAMARVGPDALWEFYGSTEGQFTVCSPSEWLEHPGTVGRARPGRKLRIESPAADGGPAGGVSPEGGPSIGTIWCEAPAFARFSYWRDPAATARAWRGDAFTVGDIGFLDEEGYLYLAGRRDDLIITGGVNVYPAEVEAALSGIDGVASVAVFALDDEQWGQRVCAAVVAPPAFDLGLVAAVAERNLAPYKRPKQYVRADDLPHTATGKLVRREVARYLGLEAGGGGG